jgi:hypothetical protein
MGTLSSIRTAVAQKIVNPDLTGNITSTVVDNEINRAIRFYSRKRFFFNEDMADITLTADSQVVPDIPTDVSSPLQVNGLMLIDSQVKIDLQKLTPPEFFTRDQDQTGRPYYWTYRDGQYLLLPTPQQAYTLKFRYLKSYVTLVGDGETNDFTDEAEDLIMLHATKNLYAENKQDAEMATFYAAREKIELDSLMERSNDYNSSGYLSNNSILGDY